MPQQFGLLTGPQHGDAREGLEECNEIDTRTEWNEFRQRRKALNLPYRRRVVRRKT